MRNFLVHLFLITCGCFCAGFGQSLRVQFDLRCGTLLLQLQDPVVMLLCYIVLTTVVRNLLVLVVLKSLRLVMSYDVICVKFSTANIFATF